jgi:copper transport protein
VALAHTTLRRANPPAGGHVAGPPPFLRLEFSEAVVPRTSRIELVAPDSQRFALHVTGDSAMPNVLVAHVPELGVAGPYRVEWRLVGPDGHAVTGEYGFTIGSTPVPIDSAVSVPKARAVMDEPSSDPPIQRVIRFASSLALLVVIGSIAFALFVLPAVAFTSSGESAAIRDSIERRLRASGLAAALSLLALDAARLVTHGATLSGSVAALSVGDLRDLLAGSTFGRGWLLHVVSVIALLLILRSRISGRWRILAGLALVLAIATSLLGHPAAVIDLPFVAVGLDAVHVLAAGGWAGTILVMAIAAVPQVVRGPADQRLPLARGMLRAFSPLALSCATVLVITGAAGAWLQLRDPALVLGSEYGLVLLRKVVIVLLIAVLGAYHWRVVQPALDTEHSVARLRTSLSVDVALVLLVLVLTATLTGTAPPIR